MERGVLVMGGHGDVILFLDDQSTIFKYVKDCRFTLGLGISSRGFENFLTARRLGCRFYDV